MLGNVLFVSSILTLPTEEALRVLRSVFIARTVVILLVNGMLVCLWGAIAFVWFSALSSSVGVHAYIWGIAALVQLIAVPFELAAIWWRFHVYRSLILARQARRMQSEQVSIRQHPAVAHPPPSQMPPPATAPPGYSYYPSTGMQPQQQQPQPQPQHQQQQQYYQPQSQQQQQYYPPQSQQQYLPTASDDKQQQMPPQPTFYQV